MINLWLLFPLILSKLLQLEPQRKTILFVRARLRSLRGLLYLRELLLLLFNVADVLSLGCIVVSALETGRALLLSGSLLI